VESRATEYDHGMTGSSDPGTTRSTGGFHSLEIVPAVDSRSMM